MNRAEEHLVRKATEHINYLNKYAFTLPNDQWVEAWNEFNLQWTESGLPYVTLPKSKVDEFVNRALTDPTVFDIGKFIVGLRLRAEVQIPSRLRVLIASYLTNDLKRPHGKRGASTLWKRDYILFDTLEELKSGRFAEKGREEPRKTFKSVDKKDPAMEGERPFSEIICSAVARSELPIVDIKRLQNILSDENKKRAYERVAMMRNSVVLDDLDNEHV